MYEHITKFIDDIEREGFEQAGPIGDELVHAMYNPEVVDKRYRETLDDYHLEGARPWGADVESLDLKATLALLTFVLRAEHFAEGALRECMENGFVYRILLRLRELDRGPARPLQVGFWRENDWMGCCSNWHHTGFDFRGTHFATSEHWMMWQKARVMGDLEKADEILAAPTPRCAKELGGEVKPYDGKLWAGVREQLVYYGVREKFLANDLERNLLLSTGSALLAEASPYDNVWGVGMTANDPRFQNPAKWQGDNLLGRVCMRVRTDIRQLCAIDRLGEVRFGANKLDQNIGKMTMLQLSRVPSARAAVYCYATIVSHAKPTDYPTAGAFLRNTSGTRVRELDALNHLDPNGSLPIAGWHEFVREITIQKVLGKL